MPIFDKVKTNPNICSVQIGINGINKPSTLAIWQPFINSTYGKIFINIDSTISSFDFEEESVPTNSGDLYKQKLTFRFLNSDSYRASRIEAFKTATHFKINFTNGLSLLMGRNDYNQNVKPVIKHKSNAKFCETEVATQSIFSCGYVANPSDFQNSVFNPLIVT